MEIYGNEPIYYVIRKDGVNISRQFDNKFLAEAEYMKLDNDTRSISEVVMVTKDGMLVLFG